MRRLMIPIEVEPPQGPPHTLRWRDPAGGRARSERVSRVLDDWDYAGRWWEGEVRRHYLLLETDAGHTLEVYREGKAWCLSRLSD
ncbi:MAG: hypothetical protein H0U69_08940 [Trueperaceae bacterium]|nr:hypothetical protein [Trueperaceae bacterium]